MSAKRKPTKSEVLKAKAASRLKATATQSNRRRAIPQDRTLVWPSIPLSHVENHQIIQALKDALGVLSEAAKRLDVDEATLWYRCKLEPELDAYVKSERTKLAALAETSIYELVKAKDPSMCRFVVTRLEPQVWGLRSEREPEPDAPSTLPAKRIDMTAALRALSPDELMALEAIVAKLERQAKDDVTDVELSEEEG